VIGANLSPAFHLMIKPAGPACNLACRYCFYLSKEKLFEKGRHRLDDSLLESCIQQLIESDGMKEIAITWQGGEPTLTGLDFFRRSMAIQEKYKETGVKIQNSLQTNGVLLDDAWCEFLRGHDFLVGLSLDGPQKMHNTYRIDKSGGPTFERVMRGLDCLKKHDVEFNILTAVHAANVSHPLAVYRFLRDEINTRFIQFIPIVEKMKINPTSRGATVSGKSANSRAYGKFLITIFDEWVRRDVGQTFVQIFDVALEKWAGAAPTLCIFAPTCGMGPIMEHTGDVYACDHFVEPEYLLGNIKQEPLAQILASQTLQEFGHAKKEALPGYCRGCDVLFACNGGCPKNRFIHAPDGEPGLNFLCAGYREFFRHIDGPMRIMADLLRKGDAPAKIMSILKEADLKKAFARAKRNQPCPCGSGKKFKHCHGRNI